MLNKSYNAADRNLQNHFHLPIPLSKQMQINLIFHSKMIHYNSVEAIPSGSQP